MKDNKITNSGIKKEIDALCKDLLMEEVTEYISVPVILTLFLGKETYDVVNASLKDAFTTSFKMEPNVCNICIPDSGIDKGHITDEIVEQIRILHEQGKDYGNLKIAFIGLMDDPIFNESSLELVATIREALEELSDFGIGLNKTSFYGVFRQSKMKKTNYESAFQFVNAGKDIWQNIFHIEVAIFARNIHLYTQLMAINILSDDYRMTQLAGTEEYCWKSIGLHYLKMPELIITRVLRMIYAGQISGGSIDYDKWAGNVKKELNQLLDQLYDKSEFDCEQYIPLCFWTEQEGVPAARKKLFGRRQVEAEVPTYTQVIKDEISLDQILNELYGEIRLGEEDYDRIIEEIISSSACIDRDHNKIAEFVLKTLEAMLDEYERQLENLKSKARLSEKTPSDQIQAYIKMEYDMRKKFFFIQRKIEIIEGLKQQLSSGSALIRIIHDISGKNKQYTDVLDELSKNEYGGTLEKLSVSNLPEFKVNLPVGEILKALDKNMLHKIIGNKDITHQKLQQFLASTGMSVPGKHNLGEINGTYHNIGPIMSALLMTPVLGTDSEIKSMVREFDGLYIETGELYRNNTFFIISRREYESDRYIVKYKRG